MTKGWIEINVFYKKLGVASIEDKTRKNYLRYFGLVDRRVC